MTEFKVNLKSIENVKTFVTAASLLSCDVDVVEGRYVVDAKSIMGLFSLDLTQAVTVQVHGDEAQTNAFRNSIVGLLN